MKHSFNEITPMTKATKTTRRFNNIWGGAVLQGLTGSVLMLLLMSSAMADDVHDAYVAKELPKLPNAGVALFGALPAENMKVGGNQQIIESNIIADDNMPFGKARRVDVKQRQKDWWQAQLQTPKNTAPIKKGDVVFVQFYVRTTQSGDESGEGQVAASRISQVVRDK